MDAGYMDEEGYVYVMSRVDDVISVAGLGFLQVPLRRY